MFNNFLRRPKDAVVSVVLRRMVNKNIIGIGKITKASLDSRRKKASFVVALEGEKQAIRLDVVRYEMVKENGTWFIVVKELSSSREWIATASAKFLNEKKMKIPPGLRWLLE